MYFSTKSLTVPGILWTTAGAVTVLYYLVLPIRLPLLEENFVLLKEEQPVATQREVEKYLAQFGLD